MRSPVSIPSLKAARIRSEYFGISLQDQCVVGVVRFKGARRADGDRQKVEEGEP